MSLDVTKIEKSDCRFKHYRMLTNFKEFGHKKYNPKNKYFSAHIRVNKNRLSHKGGISICSYIDKINNQIVLGIAFCNSSDLFIKKKGSELSYKNLIENPLIVSLPTSETEGLKFIISSIFIGKYIKSIVQNYIYNNLKFLHNKILI
jgi:hypothetical protein